jgi:hypothetical protein
VIIRLPDILADSDSDSDEEGDSSGDEGGKPKARAKAAHVDVDLDLSLSAYANASRLYSQRKVARSKEQKTAVAAERAIKAVGIDIVQPCEVYCYVCMRLLHVRSIGCGLRDVTAMSQYVS